MISWNNKNAYLMNDSLVNDKKTLMKRWKDYSIVTMASNFDCFEPLEKASRL